MIDEHDRRNLKRCEDRIIILRGLWAVPLAKQQLVDELVLAAMLKDRIGESPDNTPVRLGTAAREKVARMQQAGFDVQGIIMVNPESRERYFVESDGRAYSFHFESLLKLASI